MNRLEEPKRIKALEKRAETIETIRHIIHRLKKAGVEDFGSKQAVVLVYNEGLEDAFGISSDQFKKYTLSTDIDWNKDYPNWEDIDADKALTDFGDLYNGKS